MNEFDEIVGEFLVESYENLDQLDQELLALEDEPESRPLLASVFRTIHTIKGTSGFLAFNHLEALTHVGENLLSRLRDGKLTLNPEITTALLEMVDAIRAILAEVESSGTEGTPDHTELIATLSRLQDGDAAAPAEPVSEVAAEAPAETIIETPAEPAPAPAPVAETADAGTKNENKRSMADSSIRVDVDLLDDLMTLVGELILTRNQVLQHAGTSTDPGLQRATSRLNIISSELQEGVMKTRMQPIDHVWSKVPRVVRDLSGTFGKQVRVEMEGRDTELDRTILEAIKDPLTHIVRNAVDHAIETPEARVAAGKPAEGTLLLRAFHESGQVNIEITDDGAGIDPQRVGAKALERGVITPAEFDQMSDRELVHLIFAPGFSTAEKVTNVSGRGVGMDVVKTNIEAIGGTVDVQTIVGEGATFRIKIPLTLAIISALTVTCDGDCYAIPQVSLVELVRLEGDKITSGIEQIHGAPVYRLRGNLLPLVYLSAALGLPEPEDDERDTIHIAVLQADGRQFGLVVDTVLDTEEIVVKPLGQQLKSIPIYAGATLLGDGTVALILDILALAQETNVLSSTRERLLADRSDAGPSTAAATEQLLVVGLGEGRRMAIPLTAVTRLEEFPMSVIEHMGNREVVQYRGQILPLIRLARLVGAMEQETDSLQVVVYSERDRSVGLVVESVVDIADEVLTARSSINDYGVTGSAVVQSQITEMLDVRQAILAADPTFFDAPEIAPESAFDALVGEVEAVGGTTNGSDGQLVAANGASR